MSSITPTPLSPGSLSTVEARDNFSEVLNRAAFGKERVVLTRRGKPLVALVPIEDIALLEALEDQRDAAEIRNRLEDWRAEGGMAMTIPLDDVAERHGVKRRKPRA